MKLLTSILVFFLAFTLSAQELSTKDKGAKKHFQKAILFYQAKENLDAISQLEQALDEDPAFVEAALLLADVYNEIREDSLQVVYLERALKIDLGHADKINYVLGNTYYRMGKYQLALDAYHRFIEKATTDHPFYGKATEKVKLCRYAVTLLSNATVINAINMGPEINSSYDEYWPSLTVDGKTIIYTRLVPVRNGILANQRFQEDFYVASQRNGVWQKSRPMASINTVYNEGAQSISADGKLLFFTACTQNDGYGSCDIYYSRNKGAIWSKPQNAGFPVNTASWESQPSISANGEYLYFASNRKGGKGGMDIWRCRLKGFYTAGDPRWSEPENLGDSINTSGNETSPFIHADGRTLYFSSDMHPGLGGSDVFYSRLMGDSTWKTPENMGYPINTHKDEQGLIVNAAGETAYFSSDRPGSEGLDLYQFELTENMRPTPVSYVQGRVYDRESERPLCAQIELINLDNNQVIAKAESCWERGEFLMCLPLGKEYAFNVSRTGYLFHSENFALKQVRKADNPIKLSIPLSAIKIGNTTVLRNIFFETGKYNLLPHSKTELEKLIVFLKNNPQVKIEIGGHTDHVGGEEMNQMLSEKRAKSVFDYLVENQVSQDRLTYKGYGFSIPIESNETKEGRAKNRRTEFKIISTNKR
ncbi:OmpA family protein [uncultured Sunxiuqinia sp.]|uniref:OmpA family protein n=1 Tax=uncultured Sunxiuqinia sp. TaxID=1573825 RepID=UPI002AA740F6|nr:OmpA family protein [uncultured Sunxiuqinia sp.]